MFNAICSKSLRHIQRPDDENNLLVCSCGAELLPAIWDGNKWVPVQRKKKRNSRGVTSDTGS